MVLEALAAVGLASNIAQFIDFSCKILETSKAVHRSSDGRPQAHEDVIVIAQHLRSLCAGLVKSRDTPRVGFTNTHQENALYALAERCEKEASDVLIAIDKLKAKNPQSLRSSFHAGLRTIWSMEEIDAMTERLKQYRSEIIVHLETMQRYVPYPYQFARLTDDSSQEHSVILAALDTLDTNGRQLRVELTAEIENLRACLLGSLEKLKDELKFQQNNRRAKVRRNLGISTSNGSVPGATDIPAIIAILLSGANSLSRLSIDIEVLRSLQFTEMSFRHSKIATAHPDTCQWAFKEKFAQWLRSPDPLFWISGKPGSGKSTLMKYLVDNKQTTSELSHWSGSYKLATAGYFFWINGTEMQRSQEGLLQSILYDILRMCPGLIEKAFPVHCDAARTEFSGLQKSIWSRAELLDALTRLTQHNVMTTRFCIFIDGLDEYEGYHEDLIQVIANLAKTKNVKLCIASRPWNIFEEAFGSNDSHKLYLQDLNKPDIEKYVQNKLSSRPDFQKMRLREPGADALIAEITNKAQGVFLWVFLVVRSFINGLQNSDRICDLERRLRAFPSDLNDFFKHILLSLEDVYRVQTARAFRVAMEALRPMSVISYWYLDMEESDPDFAVKMPKQGLTLNQIEFMHEEMGKRLNGRCKGLLEITNIGTTETTIKAHDYRVDFLHRTVKDFLQTSTVHQLITNWSQGQAKNRSQWRKDSTESSQKDDLYFDASLALCKTMLAELKSTSNRWKQFTKEDTIYALLKDFFTCALEYEGRVGKSPMGLLTELEHTMRWLIKEQFSVLGGMTFEQWDGVSLMRLAIESGSHRFVTQRILQTGGDMPVGERYKLFIYMLYSPRIKPGAQSLHMIASVLKSGPISVIDAADGVNFVKRFMDIEDPTLLSCIIDLCSGNSLDMSPEIWSILKKNFSARELLELKKATRSAEPSFSTGNNRPPVRTKGSWWNPFRKYERVKQK